MADFSTLIASIEATIKENGVQAITGQVLQDELLLMVNAINQLKQDTLEGYAFYGEPLPNGATRVVTQNTFFLAGAGSYTINGNAVTITDSGISVIVYDCVNDEITTYQLFAYDANPISGSANAVTSGGVKSALDTKADKNGASPDLFAGYAGNLVDTRSAGTPQGPYAFRQSGGDGVDYMRKILGKTEAFNQLVPNGNFADTSNWGDVNSPVWSVSDGVATVTRAALSDTSINAAIKTTIPFISGHSYAVFANIKSNNSATEVRIIVTGGASAVVEDYTLYSAWGRAAAVFTCTDSGNNELRLYGRNNLDNTKDIDFSLSNIVLVDLTLQGLGLTTADQFRALHPLPYYNYNAGVLKNNAATGIKTRGFNQWDEEWEEGVYDDSTGQKSPFAHRIRSKNYIPVFPSTSYYIKYGGLTGTIYLFWYDADYNFIVRNPAAANTIKVSPTNAAYATFYVSGINLDTYNHDICINLSWSGYRNGEYEPYWERTLALGLNSIPCHDENNNAVVVNGLDGVGSAYDEAVVENGMVTKINKKMEEVDLGDLTWSLTNDGRGFLSLSLAGLVNASTENEVVSICTKYISNGNTRADQAVRDMPDKSLRFKTNGNLFIQDSAYSDIATFKAAIPGVKIRYKLATPKVLTLDNPISALVEVDNLGTQERLPADTADNPQGGFESDSNYSVSVANLVRLLNS